MVTSALNWARLRPGLVWPGALVSVLCALAALAPASAQALNHGFTGSFGSATSTPPNPEPLSGPAGVAMSEIGATKGDVYVVDKGNNRVEYFSSAGAYIGQFNGAAAGHALSEPEGIAIDNDAAGPSKGDVYVVDKSQGVIDKFSATGEYLFELTGFASEVIGVAVDPSGDVWVAEESGSVQEFSDAVDSALLTSLTPEFGRDPGIAVDSKENLYLVRGSGEVAKFNKEGKLDEAADEEITNGAAAGLTIDPATNDLYVDLGSAIAQYGPFGEPFKEPAQEFGGNGALESGTGIAVNGASGIVYVADAGKNDVDIFGFGSPPTAPTTEAATEVTHESATLNGTLTSGSEKVKYFFTYKLGDSCTGGETTSPGEAESNAAASASISSLEPSAEYTFCMTAENGFGATQGAPKSFETEGVPPTAETEGVSEITHDSAMLHAQVDPFNQETEYSFEYSTEQSLGHATTVQGSPNIAAHLLGEQQVKVATGPVLAPETTYYYRVVAQNATPPAATGPIQSFMTAPPLPTVTTEGSSQITTTSAMLAGTVTPGSTGPNSDAQWYFQYGTSTSYGQEAPIEHGDAGRGSTPVGVSTALAGLTSNTTYHYRLAASNSNQDPGVLTPQLAYGADRTFTTLPSEPLVGLPSGMSETEATLNGHVNPNGHALEYRLEYGTSTAYGQSTTAESAGEGSEYTTVSAPVSGLTPGIPYHYRLVAIGAGGDSYGSDATFTLYPSTATQAGNPFNPGSGAPAPFATSPLLGTPSFPAPPVEPATTTTAKTLTRGEKLAKALEQCRHDKSKRNRESCEKTARHRYGAKSKKKGAKR